MTSLLNRNNWELYIKIRFHIFYRAMLCISAAYAVMRCLSVRLSVCHVRTLSKEIIIFKMFSPSGSHTILDFPHQTSWQYSDGTPLTGASNAAGVGKNRDSRRISRYRIDDWCSAINNCDRPPYTVYRTDRHASVNLCLSQPAWTTTTNRREEKRIYLYAAVNLKRK